MVSARLTCVQRKYRQRKQFHSLRRMMAGAATNFTANDELSSHPKYGNTDVVLSQLWDGEINRADLSLLTVWSHSASGHDSVATYPIALTKDANGRIVADISNGSQWQHRLFRHLSDISGVDPTHFYVSSWAGHHVGTTASSPIALQNESIVLSDGVDPAIAAQEVVGDWGFIQHQIVQQKQAYVLYCHQPKPKAALMCRSVAQGFTSGTSIVSLANGRLLAVNDAVRGEIQLFETSDVGDVFDPTMHEPAAYVARVAYRQPGCHSMVFDPSTGSLVLGCFASGDARLRWDLARRNIPLEGQLGLADLYFKLSDRLADATGVHPSIIRMPLAEMEVSSTFTVTTRGDKQDVYRLEMDAPVMECQALARGPLNPAKAAEIKAAAALCLEESMRATRSVLRRELLSSPIDRFAIDADPVSVSATSEGLLFSLHNIKGTADGANVFLHVPKLRRVKARA